MGPVRVACPKCGGPIHPVAGRCKHCKADLAALRAPRPAAVGRLPALGGGPSPAAPVAAPRPQVRPPTAPVVPPPPPPGPPSAPLPALWPKLVIGLAVLVVIAATAGGAILLDRGGDDDGASDALERYGREQEERARIARAARDRADDHDDADDVRAPRADDLDTYRDRLGATGPLYAHIDTPLGTIHCQLYADRAPRAVANFVGLATGQKPWRDRAGRVHRGKPFYDGLAFHRVIDGFMIQGGDPDRTGRGGPGYAFEDELDPALVMRPGTLAMANAGPNTNGSQFFITEGTASWLDGKHTIFGQCRDLDVIRRIARVERDDTDRPLSPVLMTIVISTSPD